MADRIIYLVATKGGGVDGRDPTDKGGVIKYASLDKADALSHLNPWQDMIPVVDDGTFLKNANDKLNALDRLVLGLKS